MTFQKFDQEKPEMHLLPHEALVGAARVMSYGKRKYHAHNWRQATTWNRYYDATLRHLFAWQMGEDDDESSYPHLDHAVCSLLMLSSLVHTEVGEDDRFKPEDRPIATPWRCYDCSGDGERGHSPNCPHREKKTYEHGGTES